MPLFGSFSGARAFGKGGGGGVKLTATSSGNVVTPTSGLQPGNGFTYHTFTGPGTFSVSSTGYAELMVIGSGGGAAGHAASGGAGAGGMAVNRNLLMPTGSYTVTVPTSGGGGTSNWWGTTGGSSSSISGNGITITGLGGGAAGAYSQGYPGGCGGGSSGLPSHTPSGQANQSYISSTGNPANTLGFGAHGGYRWYGSWHGGSGGGGTRRPGGNSPGPSYPGVGGDGVQWPQFNGPLIGLPQLAPYSGYFGGGGAGAVWSENSTSYPGGAGGGGWGNYGPGSGYTTPGGTYSVNAGTHTGSGAGGTNGYYYGGAGGNGGSGLLVIRYPTSGGYAVSTQGGNGLSSSNPGSSAYQIKLNYPSSTSGFYWIQTASGAQLIYCDMTDDGGGWMLLHRTAAGGVSTSTGAVGSISGTAGTTTGTVSNPYKLSDADINYFMQWCVVGLDRPEGHSLPCFRVHCGDGDHTTNGSGGSVDYYTIYPNPVYGCDSGMSNAGLSFLGGPYAYTNNQGSFSMAGWDTYAQFTASPNAATYIGGYGSGAYTGWGTTLFYNHNSWGQGIIYNSSSSGYYNGSSWTSYGKLWYR